MSKAEKTKQFIIETAAPIFNKKGVAGTTIDDVLSATKMAKGGLYGHFVNKDVLSQEVVAHLLFQIKMHGKLAMESQTTAKNKLFAFLNTFKNPSQTFIDGGCPILNFGSEADDTNPQIKQQVKSTMLSVLKILEDTINKGILDKEFSKTFDGESFAIKMFTMMEGNVLFGRVMGTNKYAKISIELLKKEIEEYCI